MELLLAVPVSPGPLFICNFMCEIFLDDLRVALARHPCRNAKDVPSEGEDIFSTILRRMGMRVGEKCFRRSVVSLVGV